MDKVDREISPELARRIATDHFDDLVSALEQKSRTLPPFDAVILGGDFTHIHRPSGFAIAREWVRLLIERHFAPANGILLIPGNHDVNLGIAASYETKGGVLPLPRGVAEREFRAFLADLGPGVLAPNEHLSVVRRIYRKEEGRGLILVGLNSCRIERLDAQGWGYVGIDQLDDVVRGLSGGSSDSGIRAGDGDVLVAFTHHNPLPIWDLGMPEVSRRLDERKFSFLADAPSLLEALTTFGFALLLHGHSHLEKLASLKGYYVDPECWDRSLVVSGQGSFCANLEDCKAHHFAVLEIESAMANKGLNTFSFQVNRSGMQRRWSVLEKVWCFLEREGWLASRVQTAQALLLNKVETTRRQWWIMNSWAQLYRPAPEETDSPEWQGVLEKLQRELSALAKREVSMEEMVRLVDALFSTKVDPIDISGQYLPQYLLWKLENDGPI
jgi:hypothetical protein